MVLSLLSIVEQRKQQRHEQGRNTAKLQAGGCRHYHLACDSPTTISSTKLPDSPTVLGSSSVPQLRTGSNSNRFSTWLLGLCLFRVEDGRDTACGVQDPAAVEVIRVLSAAAERRCSR